MQSHHQEAEDDFGYTLLPPDVSNTKISAAPPREQSDLSFGYDVDCPLQDMQPGVASGEALPEAGDFGMSGPPLPGDKGHSGDVSNHHSTSS
jgi:hypothetical protein